MEILDQQRKNAKEECLKRKKAKEAFVEVVFHPSTETVMVALLLVFVIAFIASEIFSYEVCLYTEYVDTYTCYTTDYGTRYHAAYCPSLWNSRNKTTVYEAEEEGYTYCSKCTPTEETTLEFDVTETKRPFPEAFLITVGLIALVIYIIYKVLCIRVAQARARWEALLVQSMREFINDLKQRG
jgi:hypothetical protein